MTLRIDVIRLAGDAGFTMGACGIVSPFAEGEDLTEQLTRLVDLAQSAEREKWINGAAISVPTATMEQELQTQYRMGQAAGVKAEREACAKICDQRKDQSRNHLVRSALAVAALDIRARGTP